MKDIKTVLIGAGIVAGLFYILKRRAPQSANATLVKGEPVVVSNTLVDHANAAVASIANDQVAVLVSDNLSNLIKSGDQKIY